MHSRRRSCRSCHQWSQAWHARDGGKPRHRDVLGTCHEHWNMSVPKKCSVSLHYHHFCIVRCLESLDRYFNRCPDGAPSHLHPVGEGVGDGVENNHTELKKKLRGVERRWKASDCSQWVHSKVLQYCFHLGQMKEWVKWVSQLSQLRIPEVITGKK